MVARRDGSMIEVAGSMPVALADWGIVGPTGYSVLGSLADHGTAEFLLVLGHASGQDGGAATVARVVGRPRPARDRSV